MNESHEQTPGQSVSGEHTADAAYGSPDRSVAGDYHFALADTLKEAWIATHGNKLRILIALGVFMLVAIGFSLLSALVSLIFGAGPDQVTLMEALVNFPVNVASYGFNGVMTAGLIVIGARLSVGGKAGVHDLFRYLPAFLKALITQLLMTLMILLGLVLLVLPGIYLAIAYGFAIPLALERGLSPWEAMETSRKAVTHRWFAFLGLSLVCALLLMLSVLTLGIAYIWVLPLCVLAYGIAYRNLFGLPVDNDNAQL